MLRLTSILLSALWLSGCFVADELRHGDALIEQHSVGWRERKNQMQQEQDAAEAESQAMEQQQARGETGSDIKDKLSTWWTETVEEEPVSADPSDKVVRCEVAGKLQFLRKSDCLLRRGRMIE